MRITLTGPCSPKDLTHLFSVEDADRASNFDGYRGIPVSSLAGALHDLGHDVCIVTTAIIPSGERLVFSGDRIEIRVVSQRRRARELAFSFFRSERQLIANEIIDLRTEIVHAHWTYEFALAALETGKPVLITAHDAPFTILRYFLDPYRFFRLLLAYKVRFKMRHLTVVSPYLKSKWRMEMFWRQALLVIPNIAPFSLDVSPHLKNLRPLVLSIGDGGSRKNLQTLLKAWPAIAVAVPEAELHIVGHGLSADDELAIWANREGMSNGVVWHGYLERNPLKQLLESAAVLVHPSLEESFGLILLEAMSMAIPTIGGIHSGGVPYVIGDAGILVNVKSSQEIADATIKLLLNKDLREEFGKRGQDRIREEFSPERVAGLYVDQYERILRKGR